jgi:hypothetical protein
MIEGLRLNLFSREDAIKTTVPDDVAKVWTALREEWSATGLPATRQDEAERVLTVEGYQTRRQLAGMQMRTLLDCGRGSGAENAETYTITLTFIATVQKREAGSEVAVIFTASAMNPTAMAAPIQCGSSGEFEQRFLKGIRQRLGA